MCWIAFGKAEAVKTIFQQQQIRGLDSIGMITFEGRNHSMTVWPETPTGTVAIATYLSYIDQHVEQHNVQNNVLFHHRKGSIWTGGLVNAHPYMGKKFYIMQNGTSKDMRIWGNIELIDSDKSDTYCLLQYLERHCKTLKQVHELLSRVPWVVGTIFVADFTGEILFFSDKMRESYVNIQEEKIEFISSKKPGDLTWEYFNKGYIHFKFDGTIIAKELLIEMNEKKIVAPVVNYHERENGEYNHYGYTAKKYVAPVIWRDIDDLKLFLIMSNGEMKKKLVKIFVKAYDSFQTDIVDSKDYKYVARPDFKGEMLWGSEYHSKVWARKYPWIVALLKQWDVNPWDADYTEVQAYGGRIKLEKDAKAILDALREGRTPPDVYLEDHIAEKDDTGWLPKWLAIPPFTPKSEDAEYQAIQDDLDKEDAILANKVKETQQLTIADYCTNKTTKLKHGMTILFDDGDIGEMYNDTIVMFDKKPYTVQTSSNDKLYIQVTINSMEWIGNVGRPIQELQTKFICLTA